MNDAIRTALAALAGGADVLGANINKRKGIREADERDERSAEKAHARAMELLAAKPPREETQVVSGEDEDGPGIFIVDKATGTKQRITDKAMAQLTGAPVTPATPLLRKPGMAMPPVDVPAVPTPSVPQGPPVAPPAPQVAPVVTPQQPPAPRTLGLRPPPKAPTADPLERRAPIKVKVNGALTQAFADGHGKFYDAAGLPLSGKIEAYEPPKEPGVIPVQRADGNGGVETVLAPKVVGQVVPGPNTRTPAAIQKDVANNRSQIAVIDKAIAELDAHPDAVGVKRALSVLPGMGKVGEMVNQRADSAGVGARNALQNVSSLQIKSRSGSAVTPSEMERLGFIPSIEYTYAANKKKLQDLRSYVETETKLLEQGGGTPAASSGKPSITKAEYDLLRRQGFTDELLKSKYTVTPP